MSETRSRSNRALLLPYVLPYVVYTGIGSLADERLSPELDYLARLIGTGAALAWAWRHYPALRGQHAKYVENQLHNFASGVRHNENAIKMMQILASRMTNREIKAVASYIQGLH